MLMRSSKVKGLERAAHGAGVGDARQPLDLSGQAVGEVDRDVEAPRLGLVVVVHVDADLADVPSLALGVERDHRGDARGERRGKQLVRRRSGVGPAEDWRARR